MGNLSLFSTEKMLALTQYWIVDSRATLAGIPQTSGLLVSLDGVFARLTSAGKRSPAAASAREIYKIQRGTDQAHDHLLRGNYYLLSSCAHYAAAKDDHVTSEALLALRDQLYPDGLAGTMLSYDEEAGAAEILEDQLTEAVRLTLKNIGVLHDDDLLAKVLLQITNGKQLRVLEQQKKAAQKMDAASDNADNEERKTRYEWIDTVRTLESSLRLARRNGNVTKEVEDTLLSNLRTAQKEASQRAAEEKKKETEPPKKPED